MERISLAGWLLVLMAAVSSQGVPHYQPLYLGYVSPYEFLRGYNHHAGYHPYNHNQYRYRRGTDSPMAHDYQSAHHNAPAYNSYSDNNMYHSSHHAPMSYGHSYGYNPMFYPFKMFAYPAMKYPSMPDYMKYMDIPNYNFPSYSYRNPFMHAGNFYNSGYNSYMPSAHPAPAQAPQLPYGNHFMKMMGFHGNHGNDYNNQANQQHANHGNHNYNNGKGHNYEMSYSKSSSMNMDYTNGKGHMVTKDSSYMNDNGKVYMHNDPAKHYVDHGNGKFVLDKNYKQH